MSTRLYALCLAKIKCSMNYIAPAPSSDNGGHDDGVIHLGSGRCSVVIRLARQCVFDNNSLPSKNRGKSTQLAAAAGITVILV